MQETPAPSVVLLSGGLDSAAGLAFCAERDEPVLAITCRYGQRAVEREVEAARSLCEYYGVRHEVVDIGWLGALGGSSLTDPRNELPALRGEELDDRVVAERSARSVWVPNRNGVLINLAASYAERLGARQVVVGFNREEAATFPDNSAEYLRRATEALNLSTANHLIVRCYSLELDKRQIVQALETLRRPFPFDRIWSCYAGGPSPCGLCESCQRLARALKARRT